MPKLRFIVRATAVLVAFLACASLAQAALPRVYLASSGANSGACPRTAPCLTFAYALTQVTAKGEIVVLDTSSHAPFTVTKGVSIVAAPGAHVVVSAASGTAVTVTIPGGDTVVLRGLTVLGQGTGNTGIRFTGQGSLHVEDCVVSAFTAHGIFQSGSGMMRVKDTQVRDGMGYGIRIYVNSGTVIRSSIDHCRIVNLITGVGIGNNAWVTVSNTVAAGNHSLGFAVSGSGKLIISDSTAAGSQDGFHASQGGVLSVIRGTASAGGKGFSAVSAGEMNIDSSVAAGNGTGIYAEGTGSIVRVANTMAADNDFGIYQFNGSTVISRGNNTVRGNTFQDASGTITYDTTAQ